MRKLMVWVLLSAPCFSQTISIDPASVLRPMDGFGSAVAFLQTTFSGSVMDFFYTSSGIGLSIVRVMMVPDYADCIASFGPGNCPASPGATLSNYELANAQAASARGARVLATMWSPPGSMKTDCNGGSGSFNTGGCLIGNATNYAALAAIQTSFVTLMASYGVPVYALSVQNEPDVFETSYASCLWNGQQLHDYVPYLYADLTVAGYSATKIMIAEPGTWTNTLAATSMNDSAVAADVGILASHGYSSGASLLSYNNVTTQRQWGTEDADLTGAYNGSIADALNGVATWVHTWLTTAKVNAWLYWWMSIQGLGSANDGLTDNAGNIPLRTYALGNWAKFVKPGCNMVSVSNPTSLLVTAFTCPSTAVIVAVNNSGSAVANQVFSGLPGTQVTPWITSAAYALQSQAPAAVSGSAVSYSIPAYSIVTLVSPVSNSGGSALNGGVNVSGAVRIR